MYACVNCGTDFAYTRSDYDNYDGLCSECADLDTPCARCGTVWAQADLYSNNLCADCSPENEENITCTHCGEEDDLETIKAFDGLCEECASEGY